MEISVRAFIFDEDDRVLLVKHAPATRWTLPGGHVEAGEHIYEALEREITEEFGLPITVIGSDTSFSEHNIVSYPLPVSIHHIKYEHRTRGMVEKMEYVFFARAQDEIEEGDINEDEIHAWEWFDQDELFAMEPNIDIYMAIQEILEQNGDLLEIL